MSLAKPVFPAEDLKEFARKLSPDQIEQLAFEKYQNTDIARLISIVGEPRPLAVYNQGRSTAGELRDVIHMFEGAKSNSMIRMVNIENSDNMAWVHLLLPKVFGYAELVKVMKTVYPQGSLDRQPELSAPKVLEHQRFMKQFSATRVGKGIEAPLDALIHPEGREILREQIEQLKSAVSFSCHKEGLKAMCDQAQLSTMSFLKSKNKISSVSDLHEARCFTFGLIGRNEKAIYWLVNRAKESMKSTVVIEPNTIICSRNDFTFISLHSRYETENGDAKAKRVLRSPEKEKYVADCTVYEAAPISFEGNFYDFLKRPVVLGRSHSIFCENFVGYSGTERFDSRKFMSFKCYRANYNAFVEINIRDVLQADPRWDESGNLSPVLSELCENIPALYEEQGRPYSENNLHDPYIFNSSVEESGHVSTRRDTFVRVAMFGDMESDALSEQYLRFMAQQNYQFVVESLGREISDNVEQLIQISRELYDPPSGKIDEKLSHMMAAISIMDANQPSGDEEEPYLAHYNGVPFLPYRDSASGHIYMEDPITNIISSLSSRSISSIASAYMVAGAGGIDSYAKPLIVFKKNPALASSSTAGYDQNVNATNIVKYWVPQAPVRVGGFLPCGDCHSQRVTHVLVRVSEDDNVPLELQEIDYSDTKKWPYVMERTKSYEKPYGYAHLKGLEHIASLESEENCRGWDKNLIKRVSIGVSAVRRFLELMSKLYPDNSVFYAANVPADLYTGDTTHDKQTSWFDHTFLGFIHNGVLVRKSYRDHRLRVAFGSGNALIDTNVQNESIKKKKLSIQHPKLSPIKPNSKSSSPFASSSSPSPSPNVSSKTTRIVDDDDNDTDGDNNNNNNNNNESGGVNDFFDNEHHDNPNDLGSGPTASAHKNKDDSNKRKMGSNYKNISTDGYSKTLFAEGDMLFLDPIYCSIQNKTILRGNGRIEKDATDIIPTSPKTKDEVDSNFLRITIASLVTPQKVWDGPFEDFSVDNGQLLYSLKKTKISLEDIQTVVKILELESDNDFDPSEFTSEIFSRIPNRVVREALVDFNPDTADEDIIYRTAMNYYAQHNYDKKAPLMKYFWTGLVVIGFRVNQLLNKNSAPERELSYDIFADIVSKFFSSGGRDTDDINDNTNTSTVGYILNEALRFKFDPTDPNPQQESINLHIYQLWEQGFSNNSANLPSSPSSSKTNNKSKSKNSQQYYYYNETRKLEKDGVQFTNNPIRYRVSRLSLNVTPFLDLLGSVQGIYQLHCMPMWPSEPAYPFLPPVPWMEIPGFLINNEHDMEREIFSNAFETAYDTREGRLDIDGVYIGTMNYMGASYGDSKSNNSNDGNWSGKAKPSRFAPKDYGGNYRTRNNNNNTNTMGNRGRGFGNYGGQQQETHNFGNKVHIVTRGNLSPKNVIDNAKQRMNSIYEQFDTTVSETKIVWIQGFCNPIIDITHQNPSRYNLVSRTLFCREKPSKHLENGISVMILGSPVSLGQMFSWLEVGLPIPYSYTGAEPFSVLDMGSMMIADRKGVGFVYFNDQDCRIALDASHKKLTMHYTVHLGPVIIEPEKLLIMEDISFKGLKTGLEFTFNKQRDDVDITRKNQDLTTEGPVQMRHTSFIMSHAPSTKSSPRPFMTLTGMLNPNKYGNMRLKPGESVDYPGSLFYTQYWKFHLLNRDPDASMTDEKNSWNDSVSKNWVNDEMCQWIQYNWDPTTQGYTSRVRGEGVLGNWESGDMKSVFNGENMVNGNFDD